jgi:4-hydroxy-tetrahydrodipicolinate reductase
MTDDLTGERPTAVRVGVVGAGGRMGRAVCAGVTIDEALDLVAAVDPSIAGEVVNGVTVAHELRALAEAGVEVVVDFTVAQAARVTLPWLAMHGMHAVVGTTGLSDDDLESARRAFSGSNCLIASNFAISAVLMMRFAELAAPWFDTAEIIEMHHDGKIDAPSGTALSTAKRMAAASPDWAPDPTQNEVAPGARGGLGPAGIRLHAVRMRGMVAHQEVVLGAQGQTLTIRQDSYDRLSYIPGVLLACKRIAQHSGLTVGLESFLGL